MTLRFLLFISVVFLSVIPIRGAKADDISYISVPAAGELCLEGRLSGCLISKLGSFTLLSEQVMTPDGARVWLPEITNKTVGLSGNTGYFVNGTSQKEIYLNADKVPFQHVLVVGQDDGKGMPLHARLVVIAPETSTQRFLFDNFQTYRPVQARPSRTAAMASWEETMSVGQGSFDVTVISAKLNTVTIKCGLAQNKVGLTEPLESIAARNGAIAAINGSFFDSDNSGPIKMPDMPLVSRGNLENFSNAGVLLGFTDSGSWRIDRSIDSTRMCGSGSTMLPGDDPDRFLFWSHVTEAVGCGPRLVVNGKVQLAVDTDRVNDSDVLTSRTLRSGVGITSDGHILLVAVHRCLLRDLAAIMAKLGCVQAMNLDGGSSTGLWYRGRSLIRPGRDLSNALLIMSRK